MAVATGLHRDAGVGEIHIPYQWSYANAAARTGASGFVAGDVGKFARQTDDNSIWILTATTPTWVQVGGGASGAPSDAKYVVTAANGTLSAEEVHPELLDLNTGGSDVDMTGGATGTGVSAAQSNGLWTATWNNASWQYWDVASAIATGDFDVRARIVTVQPTSFPAGTDAPLFAFALSDTSRTQSTSLWNEAIGPQVDGASPGLIQAVLNGAVVGKGVRNVQRPVILRMSRSGTTVTFYYSAWEGRFWSTLGSTTSSLDIAKIGFFMHPNGNAECKALVHWVRSF